jgi:predicted Zn-ribbon and HTH transcriptional regulator
MFRKTLIPLLLDNPLSITQIARLSAESPKDIESDVQHFLKSLKHTEYLAVITPAECRKCGFEFGTGKLHKPSKCPECQSTWLVEPTIQVRTKGAS